MNKIAFPSEASEFIFVRTYARWLDEEKRRETWEEAVDRYVSFLHTERGEYIPSKVFRKIREGILNFEVMPSMRALWTAGVAATFDNVCTYNCAFAVVDCVDVFAEAVYILMCGTGFGYSVERKYVEKLPVVPKQSGERAGTYEIPDNKMGWADSVKVLMEYLYQGKDVEMNYSLLRPKGARLKIMGGRSSGPEPLIILHKFIREVFVNAQGRKLTSLECSDIMNQIAEIVIVGGVRRSSEICLSDLDDTEMAHAKTGQFPVRRYMSNNSAVYLKKPTATEFLREWSVLVNSGTGERGIFNIGVARQLVPERRNKNLIVGANPCLEILLRDCEFCNLSEVVIRADDDLDSLLEKVETAVWIGTIQSTFTNFPYLRKKWRKNCDEERLLGVSLTGQMDNLALLTDDALKAIKARAMRVAKHAAKILEINIPAAITCVKPSGTVSQLVDSASGIHPRYARYYIRRYRIAATDPLCQLLKDSGFRLNPDNGQRMKDWEKAKRGNISACSIYVEGQEWSEDKVTTWVVSFPIKAPAKCITRYQMSAIEQLEHYRKIQQYWCEHNASCTIYVKDEEWFEVGNWVYQNWDIVNGLSFLPFDGGRYEQAPYEEVTKEQYEDLAKKLPKIDYSKLSDYEAEDHSEGAKTWACSADKCDLK